MKIEATTVKKLTLTELTHLDPVSVILEDMEPGKGKIIIECWGRSWTAYWGAIGNRSIAEFFCRCDNDYLIGYLAPGLRSETTDYDNLDKWFKAAIINQRREQDITQDEARDYWDDVDLLCDNSEAFLQADKGYELARDIIGDEWWHDLPEKPNRDYQYLSEIVDTVKQALRTQFAQAA